jgi:hypothetical protein
MMMDLKSSMIDGLLVFAGVVAGLMAGIGTIVSNASTMSTTPNVKPTMQSSRKVTSLPKAA